MNKDEIDREFKRVLCNRVKLLIQSQIDKSAPSFIDFAVRGESIKEIEEYFTNIKMPLKFDFNFIKNAVINMENNNIIKVLSSKLGSSIVNNCNRLVIISPYCLGVFPDGTGWVKHSENNFDLIYSADKYFFNSLYKGSSYDMHEWPCYDYYVNHDLDLFRSRFMALSRYESVISRLSNDDGYFDSIFTHMLVNNEDAMVNWAKRDVASRHLTRTLSILCKRLQSIILKSDIYKYDNKGKSFGVFEGGINSVLGGIINGDYSHIDFGIGRMIENYRRIDWAVYSGKVHPLLCVPALSLLVFASNRGIDVNELLMKYFNIKSLTKINYDNYSTDLILYPGIKQFIESKDPSPQQLFMAV